MADRLLIIDTLLRGATIGAEALIAFALLLPWPPTWRRGLGAAFIASAGCYIANSSAAVIDSIGLLKIPVQVLSIISPVWLFSRKGPPMAGAGGPPDVNQNRPAKATAARAAADQRMRASRVKAVNVLCGRACRRRPRSSPRS